jgi:two-component system chemotaxis response regulator CheB
MVQHSRPSIDVLFDSAADAYADELAAVVLTGANADGAYGLERVKRRGGATIVQDPATAEKRTMPDAAIATGAADHVVPLEQIASKLMELAG